MWDVVVGTAKGQTIFDFVIKVDPIPSWQLKEPSLISLSSNAMQELNIVWRIDRAYEGAEETEDTEMGIFDNQDTSDELSESYEVETRPSGRTTGTSPIPVTVDVVIEEEEKL